jgi:maltodextrin utilization protein YvdJ
MGASVTETPEIAGVAARRFRFNLVCVMAVQVVTLVLLWLLQRAYTP